MGSARSRQRRLREERDSTSAAAPRGHGRPLGPALPPDARRTLAPLFGHSFDRVRVHDDAEADALAADHRARAITTGHDVFFRNGAFAPDETWGVHLLAHELTHVVQQEAGTRGNDDALRPARGNPDDAFERSARSVADSVLGLGEGAPALPSLGGAVPIAQLSGEEENKDPGFWTGMFGTGALPKFAQGVSDVVGDDTLGGVADMLEMGNKFVPGTPMTSMVAPLARPVVDASKALPAAPSWLGGALGGVSVLQGGLDFASGIAGENFYTGEKLGTGDRAEKSVTGAGNVFSGSTALLSAGGVLPEVVGSTTIGAGMGTGAAFAAGGQVVGAGLAGYGAGKFMDAGVGWLGGATSGDTRGLTDRMSDRAAGVNEWVDQKTGSDGLGDFVGGVELAAETVLSPAIAAGEIIGDGARGLWNQAEKFGGWMDRGVRGIYGL